ncbi:O-sialoglycoprotein endopeptidase [Hydrogenispora ethanolica]|uniref:tRNA N6-adenosine threonylcarbamoyltransferase n=1 Tax=Hydrogenispora ethanolica TaxID=1082276 RepID=A0A4V2QGN3_HYDET|nr:tRNA (adenosine(37)-N6)-threonylcarbamoyltransferase complex transferase subunit TsaD [Hydrogenispora ethanolica]TCL76517.1 O-sialoglycoprotein endopeptidase [Hydrogenispora ethanolica]
MKPFITLGIESSCDETSVAVIADGTVIRSNIISSQLEQHAKFGGVVPEIAARCHLEAVLPIYRLALAEAGITLEEVDLIAATYGPGLIGSLLVGLSFAKGLALAKKIPFIGVNHIEGHIYANILERPEVKPPLVCLTVSGGHTDLLYLEKWGSYRILGRTRDDAAGEAFDKVARVLGLGYPGGPQIDRIAREAADDLEFVQPKGFGGNYDFSFSGLKTAVINYLHRQKQLGEAVDSARVAASFQRQAVAQLTSRLFKAVDDLGVRTILLSGGVAANSKLRQVCLAEAERRGIRCLYPPLTLCTDNAAMIAAAGYFRFQSEGPSDLEITAQPDLCL